MIRILETIVPALFILASCANNINDTPSTASTSVQTPSNIAVLYAPTWIKILDLDGNGGVSSGSGFLSSSQNTRAEITPGPHTATVRYSIENANAASGPSKINFTAQAGKEYFLIVKPVKKGNTTYVSYLVHECGGPEEAEFTEALSRSPCSS